MKISPRAVGLLAIAAACVTAAAPAAAQVTFYENDDFQGRSYSTNGAISSFLDSSEGLVAAIDTAPSPPEGAPGAHRPGRAGRIAVAQTRR